MLAITDIDSDQTNTKSTYNVVTIETKPCKTANLSENLKDISSQASRNVTT